MLIERYDLELGIEGLDIDSTLALLETTDLQSARRRLRERWMVRKELFGSRGLYRVVNINWGC